MVLINDKKFSCATCIKGHRSSSCTHTDRPLFEIKKKGRPVTQCEHCRTLRTTKQLHIKCECDPTKDIKPSPTLLSAASSSSSTPAKIPNAKGQTTAPPSFPNGLRDVHAMNEAAGVLGRLGVQGDDLEGGKKLENLMNPCNCLTGGICRCCSKAAPTSSRKPSASPQPAVASGFSGGGAEATTPPSGTTSPAGEFYRTRNNSTEALSELFRVKATTFSPALAGPSNGDVIFPLTGTPTSGTISPANIHHTSIKQDHLLNPHHQESYLNPSNLHHPPHTSPHVHKTKLFSPYDARVAGGAGKMGRKVSSAGGAVNVEPGLGGHGVGAGQGVLNVNAFLSSLFTAEGRAATEIPTLSIPPLNPAFQTNADPNTSLPPMSFPTSEPILLSSCMCGDTCACPGCLTHPKQPNHNGDLDGDISMDYPISSTVCPDSCTSCYDCRGSTSLPAGIQDINQLISAAAAAIPPPAPQRVGGGALDPWDLGVLPPAAMWDEGAAEAMGFVKLRALECCNGRCQCSPGMCTCESDCCGCCTTCDCGPEEAEQPKTSSTGADPAPLVSMSKGCCSGDRGGNPMAAEVQQPVASTSTLPLAPAPVRPTAPSMPSKHSSGSVAKSITPVSGMEGLQVPSATDPSGSRTPHSEKSGSPGLFGIIRPTSIGRERSGSNQSHSFALPDSGSIHHPTPRADRSNSVVNLSRSSSVKSHHSAPHSHPRPILPRPPSAASAQVPTQSQQISTAHGSKYRMILPQTNGAGPSQPKSTHFREPAPPSTVSAADTDYAPAAPIPAFSYAASSADTPVEWPPTNFPSDADIAQGGYSQLNYFPAPPSTDLSSKGPDWSAAGMASSDVGGTGQDVGFDARAFASTMLDLSPMEIETWLQGIEGEGVLGDVNQASG